MGPNQLEGLPAARKVTIVFNQQLKRLLLARTSRGRRLRQCALFGPLGLLGILLGGCGGSSPFTLPSMPQAIVSKQSVAKPAARAMPDGYSQPEGAAEGELVLYQAARAFEVQGDFVEAGKQYELALQQSPGNTRVLVSHARMLDRHEQFEQAERKYREALRWEADNPAILNDLALCQARAGRLSESLESLDQAIRLSPGEPRYRNNIAKVLVEVGRHEDALQHLQAVHPPAIAHHNLGYFLQGKQEIDLATRHFAHALELDPALAKQERIKSSTRDPGATSLASTQWGAGYRPYAAPRWEAPGRNSSQVATSRPSRPTGQFATRPVTPQPAEAPSSDPASGGRGEEEATPEVRVEREFGRPEANGAGSSGSGFSAAEFTGSEFGRAESNGGDEPPLRRLPAIDRGTYR
jgi:tetratricopeptide (TPR) repeat protein